MLALSLPALTFSLACAVAYSCADYFRKAIPSSCGTGLVLFYAFALEAPILALWLGFSGDVRLAPAYVLPGLVAAAIGLAANVLFIIAVRRSPLSLMVPLLALVPVLTTGLSGVLIGEWPTWVQALGIAFVAVGLLVLYVPDHSGFSFLAAWHNLRREPGTVPMAGVVLLWSIAPPIDKLCLAQASVGAHGLVQLAILWSATGLWLLLRRDRRAFIPPRGTALPLLGMAVASGLGYGAQLAAYQMTLVAVVELLKRAIGVLGALIFGWMFFNETINRTKLGGIAIIAFGLPLIFLG